jgi:Zn-dependent protease
VAQPARQGRPARQGARGIPPRGGGLPIGRFFGVPIYLSLSWLVIASIITYSYADLVQRNVQGITRGGAYLVAFGIAVLLAISLLAHELGHVAMCLLLGVRVRRVVIFLLGGVSEIEGEADRPSEEYLIAIAGPLVTLVLAGVGALAYPMAADGTVQRAMLFALAWSNLTVLVFNLLPGLPLDGGKVLRAGVWRLTGSRLRATRAAGWTGRVLAILLVIGALLVVEEEDFAVAATNIAVFALLAGFMWVGANQAMTVAAVQSHLPGLRVTDLVRPALPVPADLPVSEALRRAWESRSRGLVVVDSDGRPTALVSEAHVLALPEQRRPWTTVAQVSRPIEPGMTMPDSAVGSAVLDAVRATPASEYLVVGRDGQPVGVLAINDVASLLRRWSGKQPPQPTPAGARR